MVDSELKATGTLITPLLLIYRSTPALPSSPIPNPPTLNLQPSSTTKFTTSALHIEKSDVNSKHHGVKNKACAIGANIEIDL